MAKFKPLSICQKYLFSIKHLRAYLQYACNIAAKRSNESSKWSLFHKVCLSISI